MATLTWVGGGNNKANNPQDWSPAQVPASGDILIMPDGGTMNITDNDLAGNTLQVGSGQPPPGLVTSDLNLSNHAQASITQPLFFNADWLTNIDVTGRDRLSLSSPTGNAPINVRTFNVDLEPGSNLTGSFDINYSKITINGEGVLHNNGSSTFAGTTAVIDTSVVGSGSFDVTSLPSFLSVIDTGSLEFGGSVNGGQTVTVGHTITSAALQWDTLKIDDPRDFHASVIMQSSAEVDLVGLGNANSFRLGNDTLKFLSGSKVIDTLRLTNESSANLVVSKNGNDVYVTQNGLSNPPIGSTPLTQVTAADLASNLIPDPVERSCNPTDNSTLSSSVVAPDTGDQMHIMHLSHS